MKICWILSIVIALVDPRAAPAQPETLTQNELLGRFYQTLFDLGDSFIVEFRHETDYRTVFGVGKDGPSQRVTKTEITEIRYDGEHFYRHRASWPEPATGSTEQDPDHTWWSWDGKFWLSYNRPCARQRQAKSLSDRVTYNAVLRPDEGELMAGTAESILPNSIADGGNERYDIILQKAFKIDLNSNREEVNGSPCYVLHAVTPYGDFRIWLDPAKDYAVTQAIIRKSEGDIHHGFPLPATAKSLMRVRILRMDKINGVWIPMEIERQGEESMPAIPTAGMPATTTRYESKTITLRVIRNAKFKPGDFTLAIRDGSEVWGYVDLNNGTTYLSEPKYLWTTNPGYVWNREGRRVAFDPAVLQLPVVKTVSSPRSLNVPIQDEKWNHHPVLLCFVDPSDSTCATAVGMLEQKKADLDRRSIVTAVIRTVPESAGGSINRNETGTLLMSGFLQPKFEAVNRRAWGIERLPWLVLANAQHVIIAEGFELSHLPEMIKQFGNP